MAEKRMFNTRLTTNSDSFHALTAVQRSLYFDLIGSADDYGIVGNLNQVISYAGRGTKKSDGEALIDKGYLIDCNDGFYAITDWYRHNYKSVVNQKESREDILKSLQRHLITLDEKDRFIKVSADYFLSNTADRVVKNSEEKNSQGKVSVSTVAAADTGRPTTTTDDPRLNDLISLWNGSSATVDITAADIEKNASVLINLISKYTYPEVMKCIYSLAWKSYFVHKHKVDFAWFVAENNYQKILKGQYDNSKDGIRIVNEEYSDQFGEWITTGCVLNYKEYSEQKRLEKEQAERAAVQAAEEKANAEKEAAEKAAAEREAEAARTEELHREYEQWKKENNKPDALLVEYIREKKRTARG